MRKKTIFGILISLLVIVFLLALSIGSVKIPIQNIFEILSNNFFGTNFELNKSQNNIIYSIRLPRVLLAMLVSVALSVAGATIQGIYRNPMADTGVLGISSGASFGAIIAIATGVSNNNLFVMPLFAVCGSLLTAFGIFTFASIGRKVPILTLVLTGIAVSSFLGSMVSLILTTMDEAQTQSYVFWSMGSLSATRWEHVYLVFIPISLGIWRIFRYSHDLNILMLGEEEAQSLGVCPYLLRKKMLFWVSVITAMAVCVSGGIQFVGLVIPHVLRMIIGPDNRYLIPASAIGGAIFLIFCDLLARTLIVPSEIPVGILTSLTGAPYFLYLIERERRKLN